MIGTRLGPYEVTAKLGQGGMGEVWRATDARLRRDVAIKVLPAAFVADPERLARFEREAQLLAQLQHPHVASIYGVEESNGTRALVMELVEGEDLAVRLGRGALPVDEALAVARQIAEALEAAHEKGIVHRDLKPANVKLCADGTVKVLDFGLAKALDPTAGSSATAADLAHSPTLMNSPTVTSAGLAGGTQLGVILGTAAYMAPEQARGGTVDKRADVWAFGVVLWEMLVGQQLFAAETASDTLAAVLRGDVDLARLPAVTPAAVRALLRRCLERNPKNRLRDIGEARIALDTAMTDPGGAASTAALARGPVRRLLPWLAGGLVGVAIGVLAAVLAGSPDAPSTAPDSVVTAAILPAPGTAFDLRARGPGPVAFSPDGTRVAFGARGRESATLLYVRTLADGRVTEYPGTDGAQFPFWSPDGRWIAFFSRADGMLRKVPAEGGTPRTICRALNGKGGSWGRDDTIVMAPSSGAVLHRVSAAGGEAVPITRLAEPFNSHRHPRFLPDGERFLFLARSTRPNESAIFLGSLDGAPPREVIRSATQAEYASGRLLFERESVLMAQPFELSSATLSGEARPVAEGVLEIAGAAFAAFSASATGRLVYHSGETQASLEIELRDRQGKVVGTLGSPGVFRAPSFSPDGRWIATSGFLRGRDDNNDVWIFDTSGGNPVRFTVGPEEDADVVWSADGGSVFYGSNINGPHDVLRKSLTGSGDAEVVFAAPGLQTPTSVSADGRFLFVNSDEGERPSAVVVELAGGRARRLREGTSDEERAVPSPDGRWVAFTSDETGRPEVYVTPFPAPGRTWPISASGGRYPAWRQDGKEIVYLGLDGRVVSVPALPEGDTFRIGVANELFRVSPPTRDYRDWGMSPDAQRFAIVPAGVLEAENELRLIVGWRALTEER